MKGLAFYLATFLAFGCLLVFGAQNMEIVFAALAFGTWWFWGIILVSFIVVTALVENEHGIPALLTVIGTTLLLCKFKLVASATWLIVHPKQVGLAVLAYFVLGTIWGIVKWALFVNRHLEKYNEVKAELMSEAGVKEITPALAVKLKEATSRATYGKAKIEINPQVREHKGDILMWMTYWPFSAVWTLINDPVRKIFRSIYSRIAHTLQSISDRMFRGAAQDLEMADAEEERVKTEANTKRAAEEARREAERQAAWDSTSPKRFQGNRE